VAFKLNYDEMIVLDAEALAEAGIKEAYESILPQLGRFVPRPAAVDELVDDEGLRYTVSSDGKEYVVYSPDLEDGEGQSWGRATFALFSIVNAQLAHSTHRFYAINGGNDLGGMFLTPVDVERAKESLTGKTDWPYLPTADPPWYGQNHE
jgi:hypothetical protein